MAEPDRLHARRRVIDALTDGPTPRARLREIAGDAATLGWALGSLTEGGFAIGTTDARSRLIAVPRYGLGVAYGLDAGFAIEYHDRLGSTNRRARELARADGADIAVLAGAQTGGRGRRDRTWASPPGGVYCSVVLRPTLPPSRVHLLTLAGAVAVVRAVEGLGGAATIKWPNDVLTPDGRKLAGVLTETATTDGRVEWAVVGIGLNADVDPAELPDRAASLRGSLGRVDRRAVAQRLLSAFDDLRNAPATVTDAWREHARTLGREVRVDTDAGAVEGRAVAIDDTGALVLETGTGRRAVTVGDCEHLR